MKTWLNEFFSTKGRLNRRHFFNLYILLIIIVILFSKIEWTNYYFYLSVSLLLQFAWYVLYIKRAHDFNKTFLVVLPKVIIDITFLLSIIFFSPLTIKINFVFLIFTLLYFLIFVFIPWTKWENKYWKDIKIDLDKKETNRDNL